MSLLGLKNFKGPLTNTVHLVTISMMSILFVVYRLSAGGMSIDMSPGSTTESTETAVEAPVEAGDPVQESSDSPPITGAVKLPTTSSSGKSADILGDMLKTENKGKDGKQGKSGQSDKKKAGEKSLEEIEKSLGLKS